MNKYISLAVIMSAALGIASCSKGGNTNISVQSGNNANSVTNAANTTANTGTATATPSADNTANAAAGSPTDVYKTAHIARQKKDIATLKKIFSKDILEFFTEMGKADKKSLDDMLREMCEQSIPGEPQVRNEKIAGDRATVEYKDEDGSWKTMDFVKEDGAWKMTIAKGGDDDSKDSKEKK